MIDHWLPRNKSSKKHSIFHGHFLCFKSLEEMSYECWRFGIQENVDRKLLTFMLHLFQIPFFIFTTNYGQRRPGAGKRKDMVPALGNWHTSASEPLLLLLSRGCTIPALALLKDYWINSRHKEVVNRRPWSAVDSQISLLPLGFSLPTVSRGDRQKKMEEEIVCNRW